MIEAFNESFMQFGNVDIKSGYITLFGDLLYLLEESDPLIFLGSTKEVYITDQKFLLSIKKSRG